MSLPPFPYFGGKMSVADRIVGLLPEHASYVEPYAGSLAVLFAKPVSKHEAVNDIDGNLMTFWRVLRSQPEELTRVCALSPHSRAEFRTLDVNAPGLDELERARRVWVKLTQSRSGTLRPTGWRHYVDPAGTSSAMPGYLRGYLGRFAGAVERLQNVSLDSRPGLEIISKYGRFADVCLYVDPPYLGALRSAHSYAHEMHTEAEHAQLLDALLGCTAAVVLSGYASDLYDTALAGWTRVEIPSATGNGAAGGQARTEIVWCNREVGHLTLWDAPTDETAATTPQEVLP